LPKDGQNLLPHKALENEGIGSASHTFRTKIPAFVERQKNHPRAEIHVPDSFHELESVAARHFQVRQDKIDRSGGD
jgi:hypothetical protein